MPTAASSTSAPSTGAPSTNAWHPVVAGRAVVDVLHLLRFRASRVRRRAAFAWMLAAFAVLTVAAATLPGRLDHAGYGDGRRAGRPAAAALRLRRLPAARGRCRRWPRAADASSSPASTPSIHPLSPTTDALGALLLAPLNIAWLIQAWLLLGCTAYALGPDHLWTAQAGVGLWLLAATAAGARSSPGASRRYAAAGTASPWSRVVGVGLAAAGRRAPGVRSASVRCSTSSRPSGWSRGVADGSSWRWLLTAGVELALLVAAVVLGAVPAHLAARRTPRDELRLESGAPSGARPARLRARRRCCASTGPRCGGRCRCAGDWRSSPSAPASSRSPVTCPGTR